MLLKRCNVSFGGLVVDELCSVMPAHWVPENGKRPEQQVHDAKTVCATIERTSPWKQAEAGSEPRAFFFHREVFGAVAGKFRLLGRIEAGSATSS
ncbi:hypothetical protein D3C75_1106700 [compost metagenome]